MKKLNLSAIPSLPGIYRFYNEAGELIYIGKAKLLRRRLSQYQNAKRRKKHAKMRKILKEAERLEYEVCESEFQALMLETELIQKYRPKWNVAGAFYFLYPMIGILSREDYLYLCYTTEPDQFPDFNFHGAFRSRTRSRDAFFALTAVLGMIGHPEPPARTAKQLRSPRFKKYSYAYGFRQIPGSCHLELEQYFHGKDFKAVVNLSLLLLEKPDACAKSKEIQDHLHEMRRFWRHEISPLTRARQKCAWPTYPVLQKERDFLWIKLKHRDLLPSSTPESAESASAPSCQKALS